MKDHTLIRLTSLLCSCFSMVISGQLSAQDSDINTSRWAFNLVTGFEREPVYTGSDVYISEADFNVEAVYQASEKREYLLSLGEIGVTWKLNEKSILSTVLEYEFGRDNDDDPVLANFPEVEDTVEAQAVFMHDVGPIALGVGFQYDILNRGKGFVGFLGAAYRTELSEKMGIRTQIDISFADAEHLETEVGITPATAAVTPYDSYSPDSGYKGVSITFAMDYSVSKHWSLFSSLSAENYGSLMSESPLISEEGTDSTYEASVGIAYAF